ncbi:Protein NRT1/ PTR FAMILY 5.6, partial [Cucurbita argyrosperma subsp. sororia]
MKTEAENRGDDQILVHDSSVDHKRRLPLRASTGVWKLPSSSSPLSSGLSLLTLSTLVPSLKACGSEPCDEPRKLHEVLFFTAIYLISVWNWWAQPSLESFGADQFDDDHAEERKQKMSFFNWWNSGLFLCWCHIWSDVNCVCSRTMSVGAWLV